MLSSGESGLVVGGGCRALACSGVGVPAGDQVAAPRPPVNALSPELRFPVIVLPPVSECWPELGADSEAVLLRTRTRRRWRRRALSSSGEEATAGDQVAAPRPPVNALSPELRFSVIVLPPAGECWPELGADSKAALRRTRPRRRWRLSCARLLRRGGSRR
jgi:hypothetical protein